MKKLYWRPPNLSRTALVLVALVSIAAMVLVESWPVVRKQSRFRQKMAAARLARDCMKAIKAEKERLGHVADPHVDPGNTGMIGQSVTPVTSNTGFLNAKLTSTNPNFAAVILDMLADAEVEEGDVVAVGVSGSFPALNVSTLAALEVLGARPIVIASSSSSEWGANHVDYLWLDMERTLRDAQLIEFKSAAASYGGIDDLGIGISKTGRALLDAAMERNEVPNLESTSLAEAIDKRMAVYDEQAGDTPIAAYINVGGGSASVGTHVGKKQFKAGVNRQPPRSPDVPDSVMLRFVQRDVPVIHISRIKLITQKYGLPYEPRSAIPIGQGGVFMAAEYNKVLALAALVVIVALMLAFLRYDFGTRVLRGLRRKDKSAAPEQMV